MLEVRFGVPRQVAFDYLVEPRNRPAWQSSLRRVVDVDAGAPQSGMAWTDVTWPGLRPRMRLTRCDRPQLWRETGSWRGLAHADLTLRFSPDGAGCLVAADFTLRLDGPLGPLTVLLSGPLTRLASYGVRSDLRRAARILERPAVG